MSARDTGLRNLTEPVGRAELLVEGIESLTVETLQQRFIGASTMRPGVAITNVGLYKD